MTHDLLHANDPRRFWGLGEVIALALPTFLGMANTVAMQFVDGLMVSRIRPGGYEALAAQSTASILAFATSAFLVGMLTVVNTYVSQNLGAGHPRRCSQYAWQGLYIALAAALLLLPVARWSVSSTR
jgi:Na+-driven multidrug efflux pump